MTFIDKIIFGTAMVLISAVLVMFVCNLWVLPALHLHNIDIIGSIGLMILSQLLSGKAGVFIDVKDK